jgi:oxygen-independent coproporphyrinogen-3 oxidase
MANAISLYVHLPFCRKKCPYCSFFVLPYSKESEHLLLESLLLHLDTLKSSIKGRELVSVYFGGGTPSILSIDFLSTLVQKIRSLPFCFGANIEWTIEANPEDVTKEWSQNIYNLGFNRVSLGVQSFVEKELHFLGRSIQKGLAQRAIDHLIEAKITNISVDIIFELMDQKKNDFLETLYSIKHLPITHLSLYNLMIEEGSSFFRKKNILEKKRPPEELCLEMLTSAVEILESFNFERYEISAFCKNGLSSKHNIGYWTGREFIGIGPSAWSFFKNKRTQCVKNLHLYKENLSKGVEPFLFTEELSFDALSKEQLGLSLRLKQGVLKSSVTLKESIDSIASLSKKGFIEEDSCSFFLSEKGKNFYDIVQMELL